MTSCILPKCHGEATDKWYFCLECTTCLSADMRRKIIHLFSLQNTTKNQAGWLQRREAFLQISEQAFDIRKRRSALRAKRYAADSAAAERAAADQVSRNAAATFAKAGPR